MHLVVPTQSIEQIHAPATYPEPSHWYALYTYPRHEKFISKQLDERGIENFVPMYRSLRRWKDRRKEIELVLFPSYIFVSIPLAERFRVLGLPGLVRFVSFNGQPAILPQQDIDALRNGLEGGLVAEPHPYLQVGRRVRVKHGPLSGIEGILRRKKDKFRIVISIEAIQHSVALEIDAADVAAQ